MTKRIIIAAITVLILGYLVYLGTRPGKPKRIFYDKISYKTSTFKPYDIKYFYETLSKYSKEGFEINDIKPDYINKKFEQKNQFLVIASPHFLPTQEETNKLLEFVAIGNNLYLSAFSIEPAFLDTLLNLEESAVFYNQWPPIIDEKDSISIVWKGADSLNKTFSYPGHAVSFYNEGYISKADTINILSNDKSGGMGLVDLPLGDGHFFIQMRPMTMTNYFLLHKNNFEYLNLILEHTGAKNKNIIWDNFYRNHPTQRPESDPSTPRESFFWDLIMRNPPLAWAVFTFILGIGLFILVNMRRVQKPIPVLPEIKNTSYEFTKALAGLYWLKKDHNKIAEKLVLQLHDFLHSKYRIFPKDFTEDNIEKIAQKTNKKPEDVLELVQQCNLINSEEIFSKKDLIKFYRDVYKFTK